MLLADDSVSVRQLLVEALSHQNGIEVVGAVENGKELLDIVDSLNPDVVVLDVEMPVMDGLDTLRHLRERHSQLPVLMYSSLTTRGGKATLEALALGANDFVPKPTSAKDVFEAVSYIEKEVVPKVRYWSSQNRRDEASQSKPVNSKNNVSLPSVPQKPIEIVAIGSSTGGPNALADLLSRLPADFDLPILVAQHMPKLFTKPLAERLDKLSPLKVSEASDNTVIRPGEVLIAPGDLHLTVEGDRLTKHAKLSDSAPENSCRPSVDVLFRSVAKCYGKAALAVVLTGMGKDGLAGSQVLQDGGAYVIAQDEQSSVVWGMPRAVQEANLANQIVALDDMADEIIQVVRKSKSLKRGTEHPPGSSKVGAGTR